MSARFTLYYSSLLANLSNILSLYYLAKRKVVYQEIIYIVSINFFFNLYVHFSYFKNDMLFEK